MLVISNISILSCKNTNYWVGEKKQEKQSNVTINNMEKNFQINKGEGDQIE